MSHRVKQPPVPRGGVYQLFWEFAAKRHQAFLRRYAGQPGPWSDDPILQEYKFCNVFRALDRASQYLIREICYGQASRTPADVLFQITAFRMFSRIETWQALTKQLGRAPRLDDLADGSFEAALRAIKSTGAPLYTGAFIICANDAFGRGTKYLNHVALFKKMFLDDDVAGEILAAQSLEQVYQVLRRYPLYGNFMAYQTAIDLNYSDYVNFSENDFTVPGPGAIRGINKLFTSLGDYTPAEVVHWMVRRQDTEFRRLGWQFDGLWGRPIQAIDAQNLFCETDKYCRVRRPELASNRSRIKSSFQPAADLQPVFLPPKWRVEVPASGR